MTLKSPFDVLALRREQHIQAVREHQAGRCISWCYLCRPYDHTHSTDCPVLGCAACDRLVGDRMLDAAMREEIEAC